jgi:hypothetical protein
MRGPDIRRAASKDEHVDRKALKREYKETHPPAGVYGIRNTASGRILVGASLNVQAMLNRLRAQLSMGVHTNRALQDDWNSLGADAFSFEILDTLPPVDRPDYDAARDLRALEALWLDRLAPFGDEGYNTRPKVAG